MFCHISEHRSGGPMPLAASIDFSALVNRSVLEFVFSAVDAI